MDFHSQTTIKMPCADATTLVCSSYETDFFMYLTDYHSQTTINILSERMCRRYSGMHFLVPRILSVLVCQKQQSPDYQRA